MLAASLKFADCYLLIALGIWYASDATSSASSHSHSHSSLVDPTLTFSTSPTTPSIPFHPNPWRSWAGSSPQSPGGGFVKAVTRVPVSTPADKASTDTQKASFPSIYGSAWDQERVGRWRRVEKSTKKARTKGQGKSWTRCWELIIEASRVVRRSNSDHHGMGIGHF